MINNRFQIKSSNFVYSHFLGGPLFSNHPAHSLGGWNVYSVCRIGLEGVVTINASPNLRQNPYWWNVLSFLWEGDHSNKQTNAIRFLNTGVMEGIKWCWGTSFEPSLNVVGNYFINPPKDVEHVSPGPTYSATLEYIDTYSNSASYHKKTKRNT